MLRGRPGQPVDLVTGNFGAVGGLIYFRVIRAVGRSDCSDVLCKGLMDFEHQGGWSLWLYNCMRFCKADRGNQSTLKRLKLWKFWFDSQGDRGGRSLWFLKCRFVAKLGVWVSPRRYLLTWGMTVDTDQGDWCSWSRGWLDLFLSYSRVFEVERWSRKTMVYLRGCRSQPRQRIRDETTPSLWVDRGGRAKLGREVHVLTNAFQWNRNKSRELLTTYIFLCVKDNFTWLVNTVWMRGK